VEVIATLVLAWGVHAAPPHIQRPGPNLVPGCEHWDPTCVPEPREFAYYAAVVVAACRRM
jgi:hypothetical protein